MGDSNNVLLLDGVGKTYRLYARPLDRLKEVLDPTRSKRHEEFHALRDVSFAISRGETVGVIGKNGSGKSTLLKILAGVLTPTTGGVHRVGRVSALLELGAGFNPEFTGRENVWMQGTLLGWSRRETEERLPGIIEFASIGAFIDQPVKHYSSGMFVRLAFACAVSAAPEILIVDEALAVGDAGFQVKCMTHMRRLQEGGTTILLVTHDVSTVRSFCTRALWISEGRVRMDGGPADVTARYIADQLTPSAAAGRSGPACSVALERPVDASGPRLDGLEGRTDLTRWGSGEIVISGVTVGNGPACRQGVSEHGARLTVAFEAAVLQPVPDPLVSFGLAFRNTKGLDIITFTTHEAGFTMPAPAVGQRVLISWSFDNIFAQGDYAVVLVAEGLRDGTRRYYDVVENAAMLQVAARCTIFSAVQPPAVCTVTWSGAGAPAGVPAHV